MNVLGKLLEATYSGPKRSSPGTHPSSQVPNTAAGGTINWDPKLHPRAPAGTPGGGKFITGSTTSPAAKAVKQEINPSQGQSFGQAVQQYQQKNNLQVDGVVGHQTTASLLGHDNASSVQTGALTPQDIQRILDQLGKGSGSSGKATHSDGNGLNTLLGSPKVDHLSEDLVHVGGYSYQREGHLIRVGQYDRTNPIAQIQAALQLLTPAGEDGPTTVSLPEGVSISRTAQGGTTGGNFKIEGHVPNVQTGSGGSRFQMGSSRQVAVTPDVRVAAVAAAEFSGKNTGAKSIGGHTSYPDAELAVQAHRGDLGDFGPAVAKATRREPFPITQPPHGDVTAGYGRREPPGPALPSDKTPITPADTSGGELHPDMSTPSGFKAGGTGDGVPNTSQLDVPGRQRAPYLRPGETVRRPVAGSPGIWSTFTFRRVEGDPPMATLLPGVGGSAEIQVPYAQLRREKDGKPNTTDVPDLPPSFAPGGVAPTAAAFKREGTEVGPQAGAGNLSPAEHSRLKTIRGELMDGGTAMQEPHYSKLQKELDGLLAKQRGEGGLPGGRRGTGPKGRGMPLTPTERQAAHDQGLVGKAPSTSDLTKIEAKANAYASRLAQAERRLAKAQAGIPGDPARKKRIASAKRDIKRYEGAITKLKQQASKAGGVLGRAFLKPPTGGALRTERDDE